MRAIRQHHVDAEITLLTTSPFQTFGRQCGYFNHVWVDSRPSWKTPFQWLAFQKKLNAANFTRIYDLQNNDRSNTYFKLLNPPKPEWVGTAKGASHQNVSPARTQGHALDGHKQTLALAGIKNISLDSLDWMQGDLTSFDLPEKYAILVPGCAPQHPHKRWPAKNYAALAVHLLQQNITPVLIGTHSDANATNIIAAACPQAINLTAQTSFTQIAALSKNAVLAVGNDTGPMHLIAATGCQCIALFSGKTNPIKHAPQGDHVIILQENDLKDLQVETVIAMMQ